MGHEAPAARRRSAKSYFDGRDELRDFEWGRFSLSESDPLYDAWCALPEASREQTECEFHAIAEVATR